MFPELPTRLNGVSGYSRILYRLRIAEEEMKKNGDVREKYPNRAAVEVVFCSSMRDIRRTFQSVKLEGSLTF